MCHGRSESPLPGKAARSSSQEHRQPNSRTGSRAGSQSREQSHHNAVRCFRSTRDEEDNDQPDIEESEGAEEQDSNKNSNSGSVINGNQKGQAQPDATAADSKAKPEHLLIGTPGPGTYALPSCWMSPARLMNASAYVHASSVGATIKSRNFPPGDGPLAGGCSPGPLAYTPVLAPESRKLTASRAVFGSACRAHQSKLYMGSAELNKAVASATRGPGPGAYRVGCGRSPGRAAPGPPAAPRAVFAPPYSAPHASRRLHSRSLQSLGELTPQQHAFILGFHSNCTTPRRGQDAAAVLQTACTGLLTEPRMALEVCTTWGSGNRSSDDGSGCWTASKGTAHSTEGQPATARTGSNWSFGPPRLDQGMQRRRSKEGNVFISKQHAKIDPGERVAASVPGPGYQVDGKLQLLSTHKSEGTVGFGKEKKAAAFKAKLYISSEHVKSDPALSDSPGPGTAAGCLPGSLAAPVHGTARGPRFGSPNRSPTAKAPIISKQHLNDSVGQDSPGPACYDAAAAALAGSALGDRRTANFGTGEREVSGKVKRTFAPGPGAYQGELTKLSTHASPPSHSLGASRTGSTLLGPATAHARTPGVGTYSIALADRQCLPHTGAVSIKGKLEHGGIVATNCSPGPAAYSPRGYGIGEEAGEVQQHWQQRGNQSSKSSRRGAGSPSRQQQVVGDSALVQHQQQQQQQGCDDRQLWQQRQPGAKLSQQLHHQFLQQSCRFNVQGGAAGGTADGTSARSDSSSRGHAPSREINN